MRTKPATRAGLAAAGMVLTGCLATEHAAAPPPAPPAEVTRDDCYTVVMFSDASIEAPSPDVPEAWRDYLGVWVKGAWDGKWCHDLYVTSIEPSGEVSLIEAHGPYEPWSKPATAFRRTGHIDEDGRLHLTYGGIRVVYELRDGMLVGSRREGASELTAALVRQS